MVPYIPPNPPNSQSTSRRRRLEAEPGNGRPTSKRRRVSNRRLASTFHNIPPEILLIIFEMVIKGRQDVTIRLPSRSPGAFGHALFERKARVPPPPLLSQICRSWRQLVHNTPWFWTDLSILPRHSRYNGQLHMVEEWIKRTRDLPLSFTVSDHFAPDPYSSSLVDILNYVTPFHHRLESLDICLPLEHWDPFFNFEEPLDGLKRINFTFSNALESTYFRGIVFTFYDLKNLTHVSLTGFNRALGFDILNFFWLPYPNLIELRLDNVFADTALFINFALSVGTRLQVGHFMFPQLYTSPEARDADLPRLIASRQQGFSYELRDLSLTFQELDMVPYVLEALTCPNLEKLTIIHQKGTTYEPGEFADALNKFRDRSEFYLSELHLHGIENLTTKELVEFLAPMHRALEVLDVQFCHEMLMTTLFDCLSIPEIDLDVLVDAYIRGHEDSLAIIDQETARTGSFPMLAPNLRKLKITGEFDEDGDVDMILHVVRSRNLAIPGARIARLQRVSLEVFGDGRLSDAADEELAWFENDDEHFSFYYQAY
ncbi:hypothetical protein VKT23_004929 [Stygiomarasmius scandens]|uniref:F-box domain-containing protein n=1 Tax=Marasmiellus scandens TaxID=2682957 RepID=A0ABR1JS80_9AGAR